VGALVSARRAFLTVLLTAVVGCQVVLGVALLSDDAPEQTTVMVHPLPSQNALSGEVASLGAVAERDGAELIILVVNPCDPAASGTLVDDRGDDIDRRGHLWACPPQVPPQVVDDLATALVTVDANLAVALRGAVARSQGSGQGASEESGAEEPAALGGQSPGIQVVADRGGVSSVTAAQSKTTRVIDGAGSVLRPANTADGSGPSPYVWAAGLIILLGALGWHLAMTAPRRRRPLAVPLPPNNHRPDDATVALGPGRPRGRRVPAPAGRDSGAAEMVELFRQHVPRERKSRREPQCPRCGSFDARSAPSAAKSARTHYQCGYCGFDWAVASGAPWPNVVVNPRSGR
jgi:hypothetical protein